MSFVNNNKPTYFSTKLRFAFSGSCMMFLASLWTKRMFLELETSLHLFGNGFEMSVNSTTLNSPLDEECFWMSLESV